MHLMASQARSTAASMSYNGPERHELAGQQSASELCSRCIQQSDCTVMVAVVLEVLPSGMLHITAAVSHPLVCCLCLVLPAVAAVGVGIAAGAVARLLQQATLEQKVPFTMRKHTLLLPVFAELLLGQFSFAQVGCGCWRLARSGGSASINIPLREAFKASLAGCCHDTVVITGLLHAGSLSGGAVQTRMIACAALSCSIPHAVCTALDAFCTAQLRMHSWAPSWQLYTLRASLREC